MKTSTVNETQESDILSKKQDASLHKRQHLPLLPDPFTGGAYRPGARYLCQVQFNLAGCLSKCKHLRLLGKINSNRNRSGISQFPAERFSPSFTKSSMKAHWKLPHELRNNVPTIPRGSSTFERTQMEDTVPKRNNIRSSH